jgi:hypothetical protein
MLTWSDGRREARRAKKRGESVNLSVTSPCVVLRHKPLYSQSAIEWLQPVTWQASGKPAAMWLKPVSHPRLYKSSDGA